MKSKRRSDGLQQAITAAGGIRALARALKINHAAVSKWEWVPAHRIIEVETLTKVRREDLRPDLYRKR